VEKHLILFDIDGTLLNDDMRISKKTIDIVSSLQKKGHLFYIASGRLLSSARSYSEMLGKNIGTIAANGSVYTLGNEIVKNRLKDDAVSAIFKACKIYPKLQLRLFSTDTAYGMGEMLQAFMNLASKTKFKKIKSKADLDRLNPFITNGILCANDLSVLAGAKEFLKDAPSLYLSSSSEHNIELIPSGRSKSAALKDVSQKYGIKPQNTIAFGNGENDLPMLIESGHGVAMANSPRYVLEQADVVTKSNNEDGIYAFLSKYFAEDLES